MGKSGLMSMGSLYQHSSMKCVVVGDGTVGKTCMLMSFAHDRFPMEHVPTVFEMHVATANAGHRSMQLGLFDTAGQEGYDRLRLLAYTGADIFLVCFAVDMPNSMTNVRQVWVPELRRSVGDDAKILIVGTKTDLRTNEDTLEELAKKGQKPVTTEEGRKLAKELKAEGYLECSAFTQDGLRNVFDQAAMHILRPKQRPDKVTGFRRLMCWKPIAMP